jgi:hypothetical protein
MSSIKVKKRACLIEAELRLQGDRYLSTEDVSQLVHVVDELYLCRVEQQPNVGRTQSAPQIDQFLKWLRTGASQATDVVAT